ncbi:MAG: D-aminoacylase [Clostridia bacterium]|nr:D-aminoacylase [Clostridia bacterium]
MYDLVIRSGLVYDGLGGEPFQADLAVKDGVIVSIGEISEQGKKEIDAKGLCVTPGFIDSHSHGDGSVRKKPLMECIVEQGITTAITGQCGSSIYPDPALGPEQCAKEFFDSLKAGASGMNYALLVGHSALRKTVMGKSMEEPTREQMDQMKKLLADGMKEGAMGLSLGLGYVPSIYSKKEELIELARVAKEYGGILAAHIRNESDLVVEAVQEFIDVAVAAGVVGVISHFKACKVRNHGKVVQMIERVDKAVAQGHPIYMDVYPYIATSTSISAPFVTKELLSLPTEQIIEELKKPEVRAAQQAWAEPRQGSDLEFAMVVGAKHTPQHIGKRISEIAKEEGKTPYDACYDLLIANKMVAKGVYFSINENDMMRVMQHPRCMIGTDGGNIANLTRYHPRNRGTFPRVLGRYVREKGVTSLQEMIRKMTSLPASVYGFAKKGRIAVGMDADLCIFDAEKICDGANFVENHLRNEGLNYVVVAGEITVENNVKNNVLSGKFAPKA